MQIAADEPTQGFAVAMGRTYTFCDKLQPAYPCDMLLGNTITTGGAARASAYMEDQLDGKSEQVLRYD